MKFNLVCAIIGHKTHRYTKNDEYKGRDLWAVTRRLELVGCERCGELNPNHPAHSLLPMARKEAAKAIDKAMTG